MRSSEFFSDIAGSASAVVLLLIGFAVLPGCGSGLRVRDQSDFARQRYLSEMARYRRDPSAVALPRGTELQIAIQKRLSSDTTISGEPFTAVTVVSVRRGRTQVLPRNTVIYGVVREVKPHTPVLGRASLELSFRHIGAPNGEKVPLLASMKKDPGKLAKKGSDFAKKEAIKRGAIAVTGGLLAPVFFANKVYKGAKFVTKDKTLVVPKGHEIVIELEEVLYVPGVKKSGEPSKPRKTY